MKQTSVEHIGRSQLIPGVGPTFRSPANLAIIWPECVSRSSCRPMRGAAGSSPGPYPSRGSGRHRAALRFEPTKLSKSRIKRLRGLEQPQYRLRVGEIRVFYDVTETEVQSSRSSRKPTRKRGSTSRAPQPRRVALAKVKDDLSRYLRMAESEEVVITRHGRPAGVLIGSDLRRTGSTTVWSIILSSSVAFARRGLTSRRVAGLGLKTSRGRSRGGPTRG